jgi:hypothetical protein
MTRGRDREPPSGGGETPAPHVVAREEESRPRVPGGLPHPGPDLRKQRLGLVAAALLQKVRGPSEFGVEIGGDGRRGKVCF